ncbi:MAG: TorD/DmsD family molecular chaperone [Chloroflexota bacterium]
MPPFESAHRDKRLWSAITHEIAGWYVRYGFNPYTLQTDAIWQSRTIPDHIGYELAFYTALLSSDSTEGDCSDFYAQHIAVWMPSYADQLIQKARTSFYRTLGEMTRWVILEQGTANGGSATCAEFYPEGR